MKAMFSWILGEHLAHSETHMLSPVSITEIAWLLVCPLYASKAPCFAFQTGR